MRFASVWFISFLFLTLRPALPAEESLPGVGKYQIQWVGQFSSSEDFQKKSNIGNRLFNLIFGKTDYRLIKPSNLLVYGDESLWIIDRGVQKIVFVNLQRGKMKLLESPGNMHFQSLVGICKNERDEILFTDSAADEIFLLKNPDETPEALNDTLTLNQPTGIAYSHLTKQIWVAETAAHRLIVLNNSGALVKYVGKRGAAPGEFNFPAFLWIDSEGKVYVVDTMNYRVQILSSAGELISLFGEAGDATGYLARPKGIAADSFGHIYVVDALFHTVQIFDQKGNFLYNFGKQGRGDGEFWLPSGIFINSQNRIYVADSYNARIQVFQLVKGAPDEK